MKKLLVAALVVSVIAAGGLTLAGLWAYRAARPMVDRAGSYMDRLRDLGELSQHINNTTPFTPPENGELTSAQVDRFLAVQSRMRVKLGDRWSELQAKAEQWRVQPPAPTGDALKTAASFISDVAGLYVDARRAQVDAINVQKFSQAEYSWVRRRIFEAAGVELAGAMDLSAFEDMVRGISPRQPIPVPELPRPDVPVANRRLVSPYLQILRESVALALLGL